MPESTPQLFDVHTHTHFAAYENDSREVISRALDAGVWMVNVGTQKDTSVKAVEFAEKYKEGVYASVGLHPIHTEKSHHDAKELGADQTFTSRGEEFDEFFYENLAREKKVVAIGECGLDYYRLSEDTKKRQHSTFRGHIAVAQKVDKPLMIHCRDAFGDLISILTSERENLRTNNPGVIHFFTGTVDDARALLDLGFSFSFGGVTTFTHDYDEQVRFIPLENILSETDAPYVTPIPNRGERNEPLYVTHVVAQLAKIKNADYENVWRTLVQNALRVFRL